MKNPLIVLAFLLLLFACGKKQEEKNSSDTPALTEADIKSGWRQLTKQDGKWVIFEPCEAENLSIQWIGDSLIINWGQEATVDRITRITSKANVFSLAGADPDIDSVYHKFRVEPFDSIPGVAKWWIMDELEPTIMVKESLKEKFPVVKESCEGVLN